jgi:hypothetical protein
MTILLVTSYHKVEHFQSKLNTTPSQYASAICKNGRKRTYHIAGRMESRTDVFKMTLGSVNRPHIYIYIYIYIYQTFTLKEI